MLINKMQVFTNKFSLNIFCDIDFKNDKSIWNEIVKISNLFLK